MTRPKLDKESKIVLLIILGYVVFLSIFAYFRFAIYDEKLFLHETAIMSKVLARGEWIGRYGVGVHGFLFKLPVALAYLITGPSVYVTTFFHILLSGASAWIFYLIIKRFIKNKWIIILTLFLLLTNFSYVSWSTTYHREIPVLFATILFLYIYTFKDFKYKTIISGLCLMLVLDAKEYVFFMLLPAISIHILIIEYSKNKNIIKTILLSAKEIVFLLIPSLIYLYLMFYTNLFPINMFNASLLGLTENGLSYQIDHTLPNKSLSDSSVYSNTNIIYNFFIQEKEKLGFASPIFLIFAGLFAYLEKFFYISNFSFQSIPLILLIPSLSSSIFFFNKWKIKQKKLIFINLSYWIFLFLYIIRTSHQRYLFPMIPFFILFFVMFLLLTLQTNFTKYLKATILTMIFVTIISVLYQDISNSKELFNIFTSALFTILLSLYLLLPKYNTIIEKLTFGAFLCASIFITLYASLTPKTQTFLSITWGINGETKQIAELLEPDDIIFVDFAEGTISSEFMYLINFYRANNYLPIEWHWKLNKNKIGRDLDAIAIKPNFYSAEDITLNDMQLFKEFIYKNNINKIILIKSEVAGETFPLEEYIEVLKGEEWTNVDSIKQMRNKKLFVFNVQKTR